MAKSTEMLKATNHYILYYKSQWLTCINLFIKQVKNICKLATVEFINKLNCSSNNRLHPMICSLCVCVFSVLMFVLLSRDEPANALCPQDGVCGEARDEEDREDQQPVDALHRDAREGAEMI